ncbi:M67 family metallopeptidase [Oxalobacter aliiformigenes]|uniref:M67 family metallopeptidase n=1 Tax=Oxalobacter aliiformigenes TaxID=2946593 RepID=UPI0022B026FF|nr:M67 family metallopeptidase [Oxalobacter aliiformigenes]MCZ4064402.1 M67 family metallopeptidase [Oxalobacter aliiformigenes]WAV99752.1 M67 family metallopeptidase [Oxalobacter aliiformigenes]
MIRIKNALKEQIENHGIRTYPDECCGILLGKTEEDGTKVLAKLFITDNSRSRPEQYHRFEISPDDLLRAEQDARKEKLDVLGFYHSHPDHPARPSEYDRQHAFPFYSYIIVSITGSKPDDFTCWVLDEKTFQFDEEKIEFF